MDEFDPLPGWWCVKKQLRRCREVHQRDFRAGLLVEPQRPVEHCHVEVRALDRVPYALRRVILTDRAVAINRGLKEINRIGDPNGRAVSKKIGLTKLSTLF